MQEIPLKSFKTYKWGEEYRISKVSYEDGLRSFKFGDETRNNLWISQENIFIVDEDQVKNIYDKINGLTTNSFEGTTIIDPALDVGDKIIIDGKPIVYQGELTLNKRFFVDIKSKIDIKQKQETTTKQPTQQVINRKLQSRIDQEAGKIQILAEENTEQEKKISKIELDAEGIKQEVSKKVGEDELGTKIEQNYEHIKIAWNTISEFIQMMMLNNNASFAILDSNKKTLMSLDKTGQHFFKNDGTNLLGDIGISIDTDKKQYLSFATLMNYGENIDAGMAWGIKTKSDNKFHPIMYMKNYDIPKNGTPYGQLELSNCDLVLGGNYELGSGGSIVIGNLTMTGNMQNGMSFIDNNGNYLFSIYKGDGTALAPNDTINIFDKISFFRNNGGSNSFRVGTEDKCCALSDDGILAVEYAVLGSKSNRGVAIFGTSSLRNGDFTVSDGNIYANNLSSDKRLKENIKEVEIKAIDKIKKINHKQFKMKMDGKNYDIGYIAQELEEIDKNFVLKRETTKEEKLKDYQYYINELPIIATATKAIQEQQAQIEELQQRDNIIQDLIQRIEKLEKAGEIIE